MPVRIVYPSFPLFNPGGTACEFCFGRGFAPGFKTVSRIHASSTSHVRFVRGSVAKIILDGQQAGLAAIAAASPSYVVANILADETSFECAVDGASTNAFPLYAMSGSVTWRHDNAVKREELVIAPAALAAQDSSCMYAAIEARIPQLAEVLASTNTSALILSLDSCKANIRLAGGFRDLLPASCLLLLMRCLQHQVALCLGPVTKFMELVCPLFCWVRRMQQGIFVDGICRQVFVGLKEDLVFNTEDLPDPAWRQHNQRLLETAYYARCALDPDLSGATIEKIKATTFRNCWPGAWHGAGCIWV
jgi:hypothetical protein